jgi:hypothetical protein
VFTSENWNSDNYYWRLPFTTDAISALLAAEDTLIGVDRYMTDKQSQAMRLMAAGEAF